MFRLAMRYVSEPGEVKISRVSDFGGNQIIYGFHNQIDGKL